MGLKLQGVAFKVEGLRSSDFRSRCGGEKLKLTERKFQNEIMFTSRGPSREENLLGDRKGNPISLFPQTLARDYCSILEFPPLN